MVHYLVIVASFFHKYLRLNIQSMGQQLQKSPRKEARREEAGEDRLLAQLAVAEEAEPDWDAAPGTPAATAPQRRGKIFNAKISSGLANVERCQDWNPKPGKKHPENPNEKPTRTLDEQTETGGNY